MIVATCFPDKITPPTASIVHDGLKAPTTTFAFDVSAGCNSGVYALSVAMGLLPIAKGPILVIAADTCSKLMNPKDFSTYPYFGDGAGAAPSRNICIFAGRQIDRSPTGSGVSARLALAAARRQVRPGEQWLFESCTGALFSGRIVREAPPVGRRKSVIVEVGGRAHQTGEARFRFDDDDPLREGFSLGV